MSRNDHVIVSRKRNNSNTKENFDNKYFLSNILEHIVPFYDNDMDKDERQCCKKIVDKEEHCQNQRLNRLEESFDDAQNDPREENSCQNTCGAAFAPLLVGYSQFFSLTSIHLYVIHHKLLHRG